MSKISTRFNLCCILLLFFCLFSEVSADESYNPGGLYLKAAADVYLNLLNLSAGPIPGLRIGGGREFSFNNSSLSLGLETGFNYVGQSNDRIPLMVPLSLAATYNYYFSPQFSLGFGVAGGTLFSPMAENTNGFEPFAGPRLYGEWAIPSMAGDGRLAGVYLGGGIDFSPEKQELVVLPFIEAGLRFRIKKTTLHNLVMRRGQTNKDETGQNGAQTGTGVATAGVAQSSNQRAGQGQNGAQAGTGAAAAGIAQTSGQQAGQGQNGAQVGTGAAAAGVAQSSSQRAGQGQNGAQAEQESIFVLQPEPVIEPAPTPLANPGPEIFHPERILREDRPHVLLPDGREGFILEEYTIHFEPDMTRIQSGEEDKIRRMVQLLNQYPASRFLIAGYTALAGTESGRTAISRGRARNVADFLIRQGIRAGRMELHWYGAAQPAAPNTTPANMARNRRVEFIVLSQE